MTFTAKDKLDAVERELGYRRRVYARLVAEKKMRPANMEHQIAVFEAIAADYREQVEGERLI